MSVAAFVGWGVAAVILTTAAESFQRFIIRRPQPLVSDSLLEADDVARAASIQALGAAGIGLLLLIVSYQVNTIGVSTDVRGLRWLAWMGLVGFVAAVWTWISLSDPEKSRGLRVRTLDSPA